MDPGAAAAGPLATHAIELANAERRSARFARAPASPARHHRLDVRSPHSSGADPLPPAGGLQWRVHLRGGRTRRGAACAEGEEGGRFAPGGGGEDDDRETGLDHLDSPSAPSGRQAAPLGAQRPPSVRPRPHRLAGGQEPRGAARGRRVVDRASGCWRRFASLRSSSWR